MKQQGIAITCDRCGEKSFLVFDPVKRSKEDKAAWENHENKDLCGKCSEEYHAMIDAFFSKTR